MEALSEPALLSWAHAVRIMAGESESGDRHLVVPFTGGALVAVVDGLGHGADAARSADHAVALFSHDPRDTLADLVRRCHNRLRGQRGIAVSLAAFDAVSSTMTWLAVGNVAGVLLPAASEAARPRMYLLQRGGLVGDDRLPALEAATVPVSPGDTLLMATDGVSSRFADEIVHLGAPAAMAQEIINKHTNGNDDALIMVVRYVGVDIHK